MAPVALALQRTAGFLLLGASLVCSGAGAWVVHDGRILEGLLLLFTGVAFLYAGIEVLRLVAVALADRS